MNTKINFIAIALLFIFLINGAVALEIKTNGVDFVENNTIQVSILPENTLVKISYASQEYFAQNKINFTAELYQNKIIAEQGETTLEKIINVRDKTNEDIVVNLGVLCFFGYICYKFLKKLPRIFENGM